MPISYLWRSTRAGAPLRSRRCCWTANRRGSTLKRAKRATSAGLPPPDGNSQVGWGMRLLLPLGAALAFWGYVGPWVDHRVAGLAILGLDLGEYVKFLPQVRDGATGLW